MAGTQKNKLNKIRMETIKADNKDVAEDGVESTASQLQGEGWLAKWTKHRGHGTGNILSTTGGRLVGKVDEAARPWYERVKGTKRISVG